VEDLHFLGRHYPSEKSNYQDVPRTDPILPRMNSPDLPGRGQLQARISPGLHDAICVTVAASGGADLDGGPGSLPTIPLTVGLRES
jgi:hypothetical protein